MAGERFIFFENFTYNMVNKIKAKKKGDHCNGL